MEKKDYLKPELLSYHPKYVALNGSVSNCDNAQFEETEHCNNVSSPEL